MLSRLAEETPHSTLTRVLSEYLRQEAAPSVAQLQKKEEASEILVGFLPDISSQEDETLSLASGAPIHEKVATLRSVQDDVKQSAVDTVGRFEPNGTEANIPGIDRVEHDLTRLQDERVDSSWLVSAIRLAATPSMIGQIARDEQVAFVVPNFQTTLPQSVPESEKATKEHLEPVRQQEKEKKRTWGIEFLGIPEVWAQDLTGKNVLIGHVDSGVDAAHPDLEGKIENFALLEPRRGNVVRSDPFDASDDGHGTHTAGIMVGGDKSGVSIGIAPGAKLASALIFLSREGTAWQFLHGVQWAIDQSPRILNLSLSGPVGHPAGYNDLYERALAQVTEFDIFPSCSIGNAGLSVTQSPGNLSFTFGVGAIDRKGKVAKFSGGGSVSWYEPRQPIEEFIEIHKPDVVAPGVAVQSSIPGPVWDFRDGTSMAAPHVSGIVALLMEAKPSASVSEITDVLKKTARHPSTSSEPLRDSRFGLGIIQPMRALEELTA
jgi:subtilisin family serine protease